MLLSAPSTLLTPNLREYFVLIKLLYFSSLATLNTKSKHEPHRQLHAEIKGKTLNSMLNFS